MVPELLIFYEHLSNSFFDISLLVTPLSFVYPILFWNEKHGNNASSWRLWFYYNFIFIISLFTIAGFVGVITDLVDKVR